MKTKFGNKLTDKERAELKSKRIERKSMLTLAYQLGFYVGEEIVNRFLPTLSIDGIQTRNNISVTCGEGDEYRRLDELWFAKTMQERNSEGAGDSEEWKTMRAFQKMLEDKYLKDTIDCHFGMLNIGENDMEEFKKGIGTSLWDCDCSHYSSKSENIEVKNDEHGWFTIITLKRHRE